MLILWSRLKFAWFARRDWFAPNMFPLVLALDFNRWAVDYKFSKIGFLNFIYLYKQGAHLI